MAWETLFAGLGTLYFINNQGRLINILAPISASILSETPSCHQEFTMNYKGMLTDWEGV